MPANFSVAPRGPFDLGAQRLSFGGWPDYAPDPDAVAMSFAVEGWASSATVVLRQPDGATIDGEIFLSDGAADGEAAAAWRQALAVLSLDVDGSGLAGIAQRDARMGELISAQRSLRPVLFHSPYEAACNFVIGQRISMVQARAIRRRMADEHGDAIEAGGVATRAFPRPQTVLQLESVSSLPAVKVERLRGIAAAALDGVLDRERLRALPVTTALSELEALRGVGPFSAQGILFRGAGLVDEITDDEVSKQAVQRRYELDHLPNQAEVLAIAEAWRPLRMWCMVLLHVWLRTEGGGPQRGPRR